MKANFSENERQFLLELARRAIESAVCGTTSPSIEENLSPILLKPHGAFVTLREASELRGCIGYIEPTNSLAETVKEVAVKAALEDTRFMPVSPEEMQHIEIEISVLSPLMQIHNVQEIEVGLHGLIIETGRYRGLLLPQVASGYGWDRETFLNQTCRKAGLPMNAWQYPDVKIYTFTAEIFSEHSSSHANS